MKICCFYLEGIIPVMLKKKLDFFFSSTIVVLSQNDYQLVQLNLNISNIMWYLECRVYIKVTFEFTQTLSNFESLVLENFIF